MRLRHIRGAGWEGGLAPRIGHRPPSQRLDVTSIDAATDQIGRAAVAPSAEGDRHTPALAGVRALVGAIVQRAVDDLDLGVSPRNRAIAWFRETDAADRPGSFEWCCGVLDIDPGVLRNEYTRASIPAL